MNKLLLTITFWATILFLAIPSSRAAAAADVAITNLYDAFGPDRPGLKQDFGFSTIVTYKGKTILFDSGTDARIFERNLKTLRIDVKKIDIVIISHGHYDHIGGLDYILSVNPKVKIYLPNDFFSLGAPIKFPFPDAEPGIAASLPKEQQYFRGERALDGMVTVPTGRFWRSDVEYVTAAKTVLPGVTLIPTTASLMGTFIKYPPFGDEHPQFIGMPELSVSFATDHGEILLVGCSHSTIETIIQETRKIRHGKILLVAGGFHLVSYDRAYIEALAQRIRDDYDVDSVAPAHCTGHLAFAVFKSTFADKFRRFGLGETLRL